MKQAILEFIRKGNTGEAIQRLLAGLSSNAITSSQALNAVRLIEAEFNRLRTEQLQNTIDPETAQARLNAINKRILDLLDVLDTPPKPPKASRKWVLIAVLAAIVVVPLLLWLLKPSPPPPPADTGNAAGTPPTECPVFKAEYTLHIAILPFLNLTSGSDMPLHIGLQDEVNAILRKLDYPGAAQVVLQNPADHYLTFEDAESLRDACSADLVVWGKYSVSNTAGNALVDVRYVNQPVESQQGAGVDSLLEHRNQAELSANLKTIATLLLAQAFLSENRADLAIALAEKITLPTQDGTEKFRTENPSGTSEAHLILAEAYQMTEQPEKAVQSYQNALKINPDDKTALTNKAILDFKAKRLPEAEKQIEKALAVHPDKISLHLLKAEIFEAQGEQDKAKEATKTFRTELREKAKVDSLRSVPSPKKSKN